MAPAGSYESLEAAIASGADSVYFGVGELNMRSASAANFTLDDLAKIARRCAEAGIKSYLTVNTVIYDDQMERMRAVIDAAKEHGVSAVIASDQAAILYARSRGVEVHISTQINLSNFESVRFYAAWADVVVLARELSLAQIKHIHSQIVCNDIRGPRGELLKIEMFAHGALCMAVSGKCYLSLHSCGESANRGACRQICRRSYELHDKDTGEVIATEGNYLLSPKDLCTIDYLDKFIDAGVSVLKLEGRARGGEYVKRVVGCYDEALKAIESGSFDKELTDRLTERLRTVFNRDFWGGYYLGAPTAEHSQNYGSSATRRKVYVGKVTNFFKNISVVEVLIEASPLAEGEELLFMGETTGVEELTDYQLYVNEKPCAEALQGKLCSIKTPFVLRRGDKLYKLVTS